MVPHVEQLGQVLLGNENGLHFGLLEAVVDSLVAHGVIETDDGGFADHGGQHRGVPLPSVFGPDSAERPIFAVLVDALHWLVEVKSETTFGDLFIARVNFAVCLPVVSAKGSINILDSCPEERMIWTCFDLIEEKIED